MMGRVVDKRADAGIWPATPEPSMSLHFSCWITMKSLPHKGGGIKKRNNPPPKGEGDKRFSHCSIGCARPSLRFVDQRFWA
jgi:hypothetical protein